MAYALPVLLVSSAILSPACTCTRRIPSEILRINGSSTVFPLTEAVAEEYQQGNRVRISIGVSGTGGGFKIFCKGQAPIIGASRHITKLEASACRANGIKYVELPVATDGIVVAVNPKNDWVADIALSELKTMWEPAAQGKINSWKMVNSSWPDRELRLFSPGTDSGTYDYFTETVVGKAHSSRGDIISSEDDNVLVQGVSSDIASLGYFGFSYYIENKAKLKALSIDGIEPTYQNIQSGSYRPLARHVYLYVSLNGPSRERARGFVDFYLKRARLLAKEVGFVPLTEQQYYEAEKVFLSHVARAE
jgi:phosphate transport system substrate-binding protein